MLLIPLLTMMMASEMPHHHHEGEICFCPDDADEDCPEHPEDESTCVLHESFLGTHLSLDLTPAVTTVSDESTFFERAFVTSYLNHDVTETELSDILISSSGLRAPPACA